MARMLVLGALAGCAPLGDFEDEPIVGATLVDLDTNSAAVITGYVGGDALLVYERPDGSSGSFPVAVEGGLLGAVMSVTVDLNPNSNVALDLSEADEELTVRDLMGTYRGGGWNVTIGLGGSGHSLRNRSGVQLTDEHFTAGVGIETGFEWLRIHEGGSESGDDGFTWGNDTGPFGDTDPDVDTDTGETDPSDTDTNPPDTSPDPIDTGSSSGGCNGDDEPEDTSTGGGDGGGSECSGGCDGSDACGCASVSIGGAPWWWALAVTFARRRRASAARGAAAAR
jgi:hypothetical protein